MVRDRDSSLPPRAQGTVSMVRRNPKRLTLLLVVVIGLGMSVWSAHAYFVPNEVRIPSLKERKRPGPVIFSHWSHDQYRCFVCHPTMFPQWREGFDHDVMAEGRYCGACHDGEAAFKSRDKKCTRCHRQVEKR